VLPAGSNVPSISTNAELVNQIRANDGLVDATLAMNNNVIVRGTGKAGGVSVRFWNFGPQLMQDLFAVNSSMYVFGNLVGTTFTPLADHPPLIDLIPGDARYSAIRKVKNVAVTATYRGELITSMQALEEALALKIVEEPVPDLTWANVPVVVPGTLLEVGGATPTLAGKEMFSHGYRVEVFELGTVFGRQFLRNNAMPSGQAAGLQSGVPTGTPPTLPVTVDVQPVFQFPAPTAPTTVFSYTPIATDVIVRLANGVAPSAIDGDDDLFRRTATGAITAFVVDNVASFTIATTVNNLQLQFVEGSP
jgi:hypothetical protein